MEPLDPVRGDLPKAPIHGIRGWYFSIAQARESKAANTTYSIRALSDKCLAQDSEYHVHSPYSK
jgi:hypothetical protein